jgi:DNA-binding CsgD family transcriptional regulator
MHAIVCAATEALDLQELAVLAMPRLSQAFDASMSVCYEIVGGKMSGFTDSGSDAFDRYLDYADQDPLIQVKLRHNPCVAVTTELAGSTAIQRSAAYCDVLRPYDAEQHLVMRISERGYGEDGVTSVVLARSRRQIPWMRSDSDDLMRLRPAFAAFLRRWSRWRGARTEAAQLHFDFGGRLTWLSPEAETLLGRGAARHLPESLPAAVRRLGGSTEVPSAVETELALVVDGHNFAVSLQRIAERRLVVARLRAAVRPLVSAVDEAAARHALSPAETDVLRELMRGGSNAEIARRLCISAHTVRTHLMHIFPKLGVHTRAAALARVSESLSER